ncbi:MAG: hypothetical protein QXI84_07510 [Thermofilaceae archaeon]
MIPDIVVCERDYELIDVGPITGVRRTGFRFWCTRLHRYEGFGAFCRRRDEQGLVLFVDYWSDHWAAFPGEEGWLYVVSQREGPPPVVDYPAPPLPAFDEGGAVYWTRLIVGDSPRGDYALLPDGRLGVVPYINGMPVPVHLHFDSPVSYFAAAYLLLRYDPQCFSLYTRDYDKWIRDDRCNPPLSSVYKGEDPRLPGSGRLVGEEFRVKEVEGDYLRLVGRGGDEYLAWDFVLGTLETGEWVLMGEDGLYVASLRGDRVVVEGPYGGPIVDVRGPPGGYHYAVVPTKSTRYMGDAPASAELLRWPLVQSRPSYDFVFEDVAVASKASFIYHCHLGYV